MTELCRELVKTGIVCEGVNMNDVMDLGLGDGKIDDVICFILVDVITSEVICSILDDVIPSEVDDVTFSILDDVISSVVDDVICDEAVMTTIGGVAVV